MHVENDSRFSRTQRLINSVSSLFGLTGICQVGKSGRLMHSLEWELRSAILNCVFRYHSCQPDDGPLGRNMLIPVN